MGFRQIGRVEKQIPELSVEQLRMVESLRKR
jgi:hypothetical protein